MFSLVVFCLLQRFNLLSDSGTEKAETHKNVTCHCFYFFSYVLFCYFTIAPEQLISVSSDSFCGFYATHRSHVSALQSHLLFSYFSLLYCQRHPYVSHFASVYRMNLSKGPLVNSSSEDNSKSSYGKCGAGAWRMHQSYDPLEANHMRDAHALYNPR